MKIERLMAITIFLLNRKRVQSQELAARLEVPLSTALRGIQFTQAFGNQNLDGLLDKIGALVSKTEQGRMASADQVIIDLNPGKAVFPNETSMTRA